MAPASSVSVEDLPKELMQLPADPATGTQSPDWENALAKLVRQKFAMGQHHVLDDLLKRFEAVMLKVALDETGGHRQNAAKLLGWGRNTLTRKLKDLEID